jgi:6-phosphogluconolactonase
VPTQISGSPFTAGTAPVFLVIDSTGKFLFAGNESSNNISGFVIDPKTGALSNSAQFSTGSAPTSMVIVP